RRPGNGSCTGYLFKPVPSTEAVPITNAEFLGMSQFEFWMVSIPLLEKEGWTRHQEMDPFRNGAAGVVSPARCQASTFRRTDHPVCGLSVASQLSIDAAATPPFQGGECLLAICPPKIQTETPPDAAPIS